MTTTTAGKAAKQKPDTSAMALAAELARQNVTLLEAADALMLKAARGECLTYEESTIFAAVGWDEREITKQRGRAGRVLQQLRQAGTSAEFKAYQARLTAAKDASDKQLPAIVRAIEELEAKRQGLASQVWGAEEALHKRQAARELLRDRGMLPPHLAAKWSAATAAANSTDVKRRINELEACQRQIDDLENIDLKTAAGIDQARHHLEAIGQSGDDVVNVWESYVRKRVAERPEVQAELATLQAEYEKLLAPLDGIRSHYLDMIDRDGLQALTEG